MADGNISDLGALLSSDVLPADLIAVYDDANSVTKKVPALVNYFTEEPGTDAANATAIQAMLTRGGYIKFTKAAIYTIDTVLTSTVASGCIVDLGGATIKAGAALTGTLLTLGAGVTGGPYAVVASGGGIDGNSETIGGIELAGRGATGRLVRGVYVRNCLSQQAIQINGTDHNIEANRLSFSYIENCTVLNCAEGIHQGGVDYWHIKDCVIKDITLQDGIEPINTRYGEISGNTLIDAQAVNNSGIDGHGNVTAAPDLAFCGMKDCLIHDNKIHSSTTWVSQGTGNHTAIGVVGDNTSVHENISIYNNKITGTFSFGIYTANATVNTNLSIYDNHINIGSTEGQKIDLAGILISNSSGFTIDNLRENYIELEPTADVTTNAYCIGFGSTPTTRFAIENNTMKNCPGAGNRSAMIFFNQPASTGDKFNTVRGNRFYGHVDTDDFIYVTNGTTGPIDLIDNDFTLGGIVGTTTGTGAVGFVVNEGSGNGLRYGRDNRGFKTTTYGSFSFLIATSSVLNTTHGMGGSSHAFNDKSFTPKLMQYDHRGSSFTGFTRQFYTLGMGTTDFDTHTNGNADATRTVWWTATGYPNFEGSE